MSRRNIIKNSCVAFTCLSLFAMVGTLLATDMMDAELQKNLMTLSLISTGIGILCTCITWAPEPEPELPASTPRQKPRHLKRKSKKPASIYLDTLKLNNAKDSEEIDKRLFVITEEIEPSDSKNSQSDSPSVSKKSNN